jgi:hypothetical protein
MSDDKFEKLSRAFYLKSKISHYPLSHSIIPVPEGMSVVLFLTDKDSAEYLSIREITDPENFEKVAIRSFYDTIREFAEIGYIGVWLYNNFPVRFGNYFSDIDIDLPSFAYTFSGTFIGSSGTIAEPRAFLPWSNFTRVDKIIRRFVTYPNGLFFDVSEPVYSIAQINEALSEQRLSGEGIEAIPVARFQNASPLQGPYISDMGAYCLFSSLDEARRFCHSRSISETDGYEIVELNDFMSFWEQVGRDHPMIDVSLNPGSERHLQGYFLAVPDRIILRTVIGFFEILPTGSATEIEPFEELPKPDTIDDANEIDESLRSVNSTIDHPLKRIMGSTKGPMNRREARQIIEKLFGADAESLRNDRDDEEQDLMSIGADCYVIEGFDKISGSALNSIDESAPLVFPDVLAAIAYLHFEVLVSDADIKQNGYHLCHANFTVAGAGDKELKLWILTEQQSAVRDLAEEILTEGYRLEHSELLKAFINRNSPVVEITRCGYVGDLAMFSEGDPFPCSAEDDMSQASDCALARLRSVAKSYHSRKTQMPGLDERIQNRIRIHLGESYANISVATLLILETAIKQLATAPQRQDHDYAGISMQLCKAFEREMSLLIFNPACSHIKSMFNKNQLKAMLDVAESRGDITESKLISLVLGRGKLELGSMAYVVRRVSENCDTPIFELFLEYVKKLENHEFLLSDDFQSICKQISTKFRNGGVHEKIITYDICKEAFREILEVENSFLSRLAAVKQARLTNSMS